MSSWDSKYTQEHLKELHQEAQAARLAQQLPSGRPGPTHRLLSGAGDLLIDAGLWLKSRYHKTDGRPHRFILLDLG
jgi:hypothetical protein